MTEPGTTAQDTLRDDILAGGHDDWVSMAEVRGCISRGRLADSASERQQLMLQTIRSLLQDRLVEVGDIPAPGDPGFLVWPGTLDEVMAQPDRADRRPLRRSRLVGILDLAQPHPEGSRGLGRCRPQKVLSAC